MPSTPKTFLTAEWRHLLMLNYAVDPSLLRPFLPAGTELDFWNGRCYASIVGFMFLKTRVLGIPIPFHVNFEEVNLRFYVRRKGPEGWRRGVVFVKEIVPKPAIAWTARLLYNEQYVTMPMRHAIEPRDADLSVRYAWRQGGDWQHVSAVTKGEKAPLIPGGEAEFITEHYWGYAKQRDGGTVEYRVLHPPWQVWQVSDYSFEADVAALYGEAFVAPLADEPLSVFVAEGSAVSVQLGGRI